MHATKRPTDDRGLATRDRTFAPLSVICPQALYVISHRRHMERKCADTTGTVLVPYGLAVSNAKIHIYIFQIKYTRAIL